MDKTYNVQLSKLLERYGKSLEGLGELFDCSIDDVNINIRLIYEDYINKLKISVLFNPIISSLIIMEIDKFGLFGCKERNESIGITTFSALPVNSLDARIKDTEVKIFDSGLIVFNVEADIELIEEINYELKCLGLVPWAEFPIAL